jgi:hypothetical protein
VFDCDSPCVFRDISMGYGGTPQTSGGCAIRFGNGPTGGGVSVDSPVIDNCHFSAGFYDCIVGKTTHNIKSSGNYAVNFVNTFITGGSGGDACFLTSTNDTTVCTGLGSPAFASVYFTSGWVIITAPQFGSGVNNSQIQYGVKGYITGTSTSGSSVIGGAIAYFSTAGFHLTVNGSGIFYQYVNICGVHIHAEDTNIVNTLIQFVASGGSPGIKNVTIGSNTLQGGGSSATGIDLTGVTGTVTLGPNDISLVGTRTVAYNPWTALPTLQNSWSDSGFCAPVGYLQQDLGVWLRGEIHGGTQTDGTLLFTFPAGCRPAHVVNVSLQAQVSSSFTVARLTVGTDGAARIYGIGALSSPYIDMNVFVPLG